MTIVIPPADQSPDISIPVVSDVGLVRGALGLALFSFLSIGLLYPLAGVGLGQALFPAAANGSLIEVDGQVVGSSLVAQPFADDRYFSARPSAGDHQPMNAGGSNEARTNPELRQRIDEALSAVALREGVAVSEVPSDLVTQSGGGFDPHISPPAASIQVARVAQARGLEQQAVADLLATHTQAPQWGILGQHSVNVLELNLALDALQVGTVRPAAE
ncbi:potassium-transporting ATPase subunit KdpC [Halopseudomonas pelagia]|uniref:potassium-transporting ATPase subunit KdpC n=1 Tax=Halopseudomonas pelagia TaxID=553151 RepID=UPI0003B59DA5|nr:potassium-transporting ATPase subunit KdpC [Halopseudomonas pelagia]|tara:strand:+ start:97 stop:747 length:651 start_codon:yes stop_codon:yes gene_type:complete